MRLPSFVRMDAQNLDRNCGIRRVLGVDLAASLLAGVADAVVAVSFLEDFSSKGLTPGSNKNGRDSCKPARPLSLAAAPVEDLLPVVANASVFGAERSSPSEESLTVSVSSHLTRR